MTLRENLILREVAEALVTAATMTQAIGQATKDDALVNGDAAIVYGRIAHAETLLAKLHSDYLDVKSKIEAEAMDRARNFTQA